MYEKIHGRMHYAVEGLRNPVIAALRALQSVRPPLNIDVKSFIDIAQEVGDSTTAHIGGMVIERWDDLEFLTKHNGFILNFKESGITAELAPQAHAGPGSRSIRIEQVFPGFRLRGVGRSASRRSGFRRSALAL